MRYRRGFTLVELLVVIGIIAILISILIPTLGKAQSAAKAIQCGSNLRQIGIGLTRYFSDFKHLPVRQIGPSSQANPHVFRLWTAEDPYHVAETMEKYGGSKRIYYCPANTLGRTAENYWPYMDFGIPSTIASNYQFPFLLADLMWMIPKPDYRKLTSDRILAADYLGVTLDFEGVLHVVAWNHEKLQDGSPRGMNMLFGDGHVDWNNGSHGWVMYAWYGGSVYWHYAQF